MFRCVILGGGVVNKLVGLESKLKSVGFFWGGGSNNLKLSGFFSKNRNLPTEST